MIRKAVQLVGGLSGRSSLAQLPNERPAMARSYLLWRLRTIRSNPEAVA